MPKLKINIPRDIKHIQKMFNKNNKKLYLVGGAVRDAILGKKPKDFDLATDAKPEEVLAMAKNAGLKTLELGKSFGVVVINGHEIATFRKDFGKGRRPKSVDYTDIEGDVKRRDLTINALFYDIDKEEIVDLVGGIEDLKKKKIRTVGIADERFDEDPLRKLRALRFYGLMDGDLHDDTYTALKKNPSLRGVSHERIRDEFIKGIQKSKSTKKYLNLAKELKILDQILPGLKINHKFINENDYQILIADLLKSNDADIVKKKLNQLKYNSDEIKNIVFLILMLKFDSKNIYQYKKLQNLTSLSDRQISRWGEYNGRNFQRFLDFTLTVGGKDAPVGLRGPEIGNWIKEKETQKYLNENKIRDIIAKEIHRILI